MLDRTNAATADRPERSYWSSLGLYELREPTSAPNVLGRMLADARPMAPDRWLVRRYTGDVVDLYVSTRTEALAELDRIADAWMAGAR